MNENFSSALILLVIGMVTVFVILALVVLMGNLLIRVVNHLFPETIHLKHITPPASGSDIPPSKMAAIIAAVDLFTEGKGKITRIDKQN